MRRIALALALLVCVCRTANGADIFVTSLADKISDTGGCSLKEAILSANGDTNFIFTSPTTGFFTPCVAGSGDDTIVLPSSRLIFLSQIADDPDSPFGPAAMPMITSRITIEMNGTRLEWIGASHVRAFAVAATGDLTIRNAYIVGFSTKGGNGAEGGGGGLGAGGAIYVKGAGSLTVESSTFERNQAIGGNGADLRGQLNGGGGGGVFGNGGEPGPDGFASNGGGGGGGSRGNGGNGSGDGRCGGSGCEGTGGGGGGTLTDGQTAVSGKGILGFGGFACGGDGGVLVIAGGGDGADAPCAGGGGGGGSSRRSIGVTAGDGGKGSYGGGGGGGGYDSGAGGDGGFGGGGGGASSDGGVLGASGGNGGFGAGGGGAGSGLITGPGHGGAFGGNGSTHGGGGGAALGGAIFSDGGTISILNSTFTNNAAIGGTRGADDATDGLAAGGAIFSVDGSVTIRYATISGNETINGNQNLGDAGALMVFQLPAPQPAATSLALFNTIMSGDGDQACVAIIFSGSSSGSGNLIQHNGNCAGAADADPMLAPLALNDGLTPTMAISDSSPAFNAADPSIEIHADQRGAHRPQGAGFDIGAYELCVFNPKENCFGFQGVVQTRHLDTSALPSIGGTVAPPSGDYPLDSVQALTAIAKPGFAFTGWTGAVADPASANTFVVMDHDQTVVANFSGCVTNISGRGTPGNAVAPPRVDLTWFVPGADHALVERSPASGGPYAVVGNSTGASFSDRTAGLANNTTFYYVVQFFTSTGVPMCLSNEVAVMIPRGR